MTPGARVAAAIEILDEMADGLAAEQALTRWARRSRFAGSKDRAAVRDHVFDVLRCRRSAAYLGGGTTGRALMIGLLRDQAADLAAVFTAEGHAPAPLSPAELDAPDAGAMPEADRWNLPDWLLPPLRASLGDAAADTALLLQTRAPVTLRVNAARISVSAAQEQLRDAGINTEENPICAGALTVTQGARRLRNSAPYQEGLVELQDAASQAVVAALPAAGRVLDYCAGGGGKALALAMAPDRQVFAHDIDPLRMVDLPPRALRAGVEIQTLKTDALRDHGPFDLILCDAPCSGSGAWRRAPEGKWTLSANRLKKLNEIQDDILERASALLAPGGVLAYATCSVLRSENEDRVQAFLARHPGWRCTQAQRYDIAPGNDGFFAAHLTAA